MEELKCTLGFVKKSILRLYSKYTFLNAISLDLVTTYILRKKRFYVLPYY